jgi:hypothetical protein
MRLLVLAGVVVVSAVILKINWDSWRTVRAATIDLDYVDGLGDEQRVHKRGLAQHMTGKR